jgi:hypothetical protein
MKSPCQLEAGSNKNILLYPESVLADTFLAEKGLPLAAPVLPTEKLGAKLGVVRSSLH